MQDLTGPLRLLPEIDVRHSLIPTTPPVMQKRKGRCEDLGQRASRVQDIC